MHPDSSILLYRLDITTPLLAFYDAPTIEGFEPVIESGRGTCVFDYINDWYEGKTLHLTKKNFGCPGAGRSICGVESFPAPQLVEFLVEKEGLKASKELMMEWVNNGKMFKPEHDHVLIGPLKMSKWEYVKTIAFAVNADQMSALMTGAQYFAGADDPVPVIAKFSSGCGQMVAFDDLDVPQALIGATDTAMRENLQADQILFVVTKPMFENLCRLDEKSFLYKNFWTGLRKARGLPDLV